MEQQHIIHQQIIAATVTTEEEAKAFHQKISQLNESKLPKLIDELCNNLGIGTDLLEIPQMEIDLGILPKENWEEELLKRYVNQLNTVLVKKKNQAVPIGLKDFSLRSAQTDQVLDRNSALLKTFFEFISTGHITNCSLFINRHEFEKSMLAILDLSDAKQKAKTFLLDKASTSSNVIERLLKQFSLYFIEKLILKVWELKGEEWDQLYRIFQSFRESKNTKHATTRSDQKLAFTKTTLNALISMGKSKKSMYSIFDHCRLIFEKGLYINVNKGVVLNKIRKDQLYVPDNDQNMIGDAIISTPDYFIENAGLVILATYLPMFFKELKFLSQGQFTSEAHHEKAILMSQYLITGETESAEHLLPLNKILCGWPLDKPLVSGIEMLEEEKNEASHLLKAVIKHWGKLRNASVAALQETFLQRKATLNYREGHQDWYLNVEYKSGIDLLTSQIPWTISMIKLPWMQHKIFVDWV